MTSYNREITDKFKHLDKNKHYPHNDNKPIPKSMLIDITQLLLKKYAHEDIISELSPKLINRVMTTLYIDGSLSNSIILNIYIYGWSSFDIKNDDNITWIWENFYDYMFDGVEEEIEIL